MFNFALGKQGSSIPFLPFRYLRLLFAPFILLAIGTAATNELPTVHRSLLLAHMSALGC